LNVVFRKFDLAVRTKYVLFRLDYQAFRESISKLGVSLPSPPPQPTTGYLVPSGVIPTGIGRTGIEIDISGGIIAARGVAPKETLDLFSKIVDSVNRDLELNLDENAWFYEIVSSCSVKIDKDPIEALLQRFGASCDLSELEKTFGVGAQINRIRIGPQHADPNTTSYYDIDIMPDIFRPRDSMLIEFVYREPKLEPIQKVAGDMDAVISKVVLAIV